MSFFRLSIIALLACCLTSCKEIVNQVLDQYEGHSFVSNQTQLDVVITYQVKDQPYSIEVKAGQQVEIPDNQRLGLTEHPELIDAVTFTFSDGTSYEHRSQSTIDSKGYYHFTFIPQKNNILCGEEYDACSWVMKRIGGRTNSYTYTIGWKDLPQN